VACVSDDDFAALIAGTLKPAEARGVKEHLAACEVCAELYSDLQRAADDATTDSVDPMARTVYDGSGPGAETSFVPGAQVGRFVVEDFIGAGGMSSVYRAFDPKLDRRVALKVLSPRVRDPDLILREARALAALTHPNVVTVYDVGEVDRQVFLAMEYVDGQTLRDWAKARPRGWREVVAVYLAAGRGLAAAHAAGLAHRDFKPGNVLLGEDGRVRVCDFGLVGNAVSVDSKDEPGSTVGTPAYMAPEQAAGVADARSDQFSFCVSLGEALTGRRPSAVSGVDGAGLPRPLARAIDRGLSWSPVTRFPSMDALLAELERAVNPWRTRRWLLAGGAVAVLATASLVGARLAGERPDPCAGGAARLAGVWDDARKQQARATFVASGRDNAASAFDDAAGQLDGYAGAWIDYHRETCAATAVRHEQSAEALDLRMACLDRRRGELDAAAKVLVAADRETVDRAGDVARTPAPLAACDDARELAATGMPDDPAQRARVAALDGRVAEAFALVAAGKVKRAGEELEPLVAEARALGDRPLLARALRALGNVEVQTSAVAAEPHILEAIELAETTGQDLERGRALRDLLTLRSVQRRAPEGHLAAGLAHFALRRARGAALVDFIKVFDIEGDVYLREGRFVEARALYELSHLLERSRVDAPAEGWLGHEGRMATTYMEERNYPEARRRIEKALRGFAEHGLTYHRMVPKLYNNLGAVCVRLKDQACALEAFEKSVEAKERVFGPDSLTVAISLGNLAGMYTKLGRLDEAEKLLHRAIAITEKADRVDSQHAGAPFMELGNIEIARHHPEKAAEWFERSLRIYEATHGKPSDVADARFSLAAAIWEARRDRRAFAMMAEARAVYVRLGDGYQSDIDEVDAWRRKAR
jgi:tetratricopeptide (TPR) repeat protein/predicted Ser/Thr protein kinase